MKDVDDEKQLKIDTDYIDSNRETIDKAISWVFENYKPTKKQVSELVEILKLNIQKCGWIDNYTGIVIAGYGEREIFPTIHNFLVSGRLGKSLIYFAEDITKIDGDEHTALIAPYAQTEMVHQFVRGIDPSFAETITGKFDAILRSMSSLLRDEDKPKIESLSSLLSDYIQETSDNVYKEPIMDIVATMEKSEMIGMAEAMVNLTALKRHISTDEETVGGPVDVALITKGDGFIWIKNKTNYDPSLNRDLNQSYFRGGRNGSL
jgi:hypothetical protein